MKTREHWFCLISTWLLVFFIASLTLMTWNVLHWKSSASPMQLAMPLSNAFKLTFSGADVRIMPLGDSITAGEKSSTKAGYRLPLWKACQAEGWNVQFVGSKESGPPAFPARANEGHGGWRIDQISRYVVHWLEIYQPQIILLHIGTNDIIQGYTLKIVISRLDHLLQQIVTTVPDADLVVAQIIPLGKPALNKEVVAYNHAIPGLVKEMEAQHKHVELADMYDAVPSADLVDHIHPDAHGYTLIAGVWYNVLRTIINGKEAAEDKRPLCPPTSCTTHK